MSVEATTWVWDHSPEQNANRWVLLCLAEYADKTGANARPSAETIARRTTFSERHIRRALADMRRRGVIVAQGIHKSGVTVYQIQMTLTPCHPDTGVTLTPTSATPDTRVTPPLTPVSPDSSRTIKNHPVVPRKRDPIWDELIIIEGEPATKSERSRLNDAAKQLRDAEIDPALIPVAARNFRKEWPNATLTAHALVANFTRFTNGHRANGHAARCPHAHCQIEFRSEKRLAEHLADVHGERTP